MGKKLSRRIIIIISARRPNFIIITKKKKEKREKSFSFLDQTVCISHSANSYRKGMNPTNLPPAMDKQSSRLLFDLVMPNGLGEGKLLKDDLVLNPTWAEDSVNIHFFFFTFGKKNKASRVVTVVLLHNSVFYQKWLLKCIETSFPFFFFSSPN